MKQLKFKAIGFPVDNIKVRKFTERCGILITSMIWPLAGFLYFVTESPLKVSLVLYAGLYFILSVGSNSAYISGIFYHLKQTNEILQAKLAEKSKNNEKDFAKLTEIYSDLMNICDDINLTFGFPTMLGFGAVFFYTIFSTFTAYMDIIGEGKLSQITISSLGFSVYYLFFLTVVILVCSKVNTEVCCLKS